MKYSLSGAYESICVGGGGQQKKNMCAPPWPHSTPPPKNPVLKKILTPFIIDSLGETV